MAHGRRDLARGGLTLAPSRTEDLLYASATPQACPSPRTYHYTRVRADGSVLESEARCEGPVRKNGFYGRGIVNAFSAVR